MEPMFNEDYVEYHLYQLHSDEHIDHNHIQQFVESKSRNYLWQKDSFSLCREDMGELVHMFGYTRFGDNIEDEWFIVYLLYEISKRYPSIVISVMDNDGQFLLIEAAFAIPKWLKPDNSNNRVFIWNGKVHIIPTPRNPFELSLIPPSPTTKQAIELILNKLVQTEASNDVQQILCKRIEQYPEKAQEESSHYAACWLPVRVAWILNQCPQLVTKAATAFYYRDLSDMKVIYDMMSFTPSPLPVNDSQMDEALHIAINDKGSVLARVRFTRCSYAQLQRQQFEPPPCFGYPPPPSHKYHKAWHLGAKLAAGFEILYKFSHLGTEPSLGTIATHDDNNWKLFDNLLKQYGYYSSADNMQDLEAHAKQCFLAWNLSTKDVSHIDAMSATMVIHNVLKQAQNHSLPVFPQLSSDSSESWLEISVEHLDMLLKDRGSVSKEQKKNNLEEQDMNQERFDSLIDKMTQFMEQKSSFEGVEAQHSESDSENDNPIEFDENAFISRLSGFGTQESHSDDEESDSDSNDIQDAELMDIMKQMDAELRSNSFETEEGKEVDVNINMVKNLLESYSMQQGLPGPLTNILGEMYSPKK